MHYPNSFQKHELSYKFKAEIITIFYLYLTSTKRLDNIGLRPRLSSSVKTIHNRKEIEEPTLHNETQEMSLNLTLRKIAI